MKSKKVTNKDANNYWVCIIGPVKRKELPDGADAQPRNAAQDAVIDMIGRQPDCWSGWGTSKEKFNKIMSIWNEDC